jgi:ribosomal peptide maturation radical SAM protein 1
VARRACWVPGRPSGPRRRAGPSGRFATTLTHLPLPAVGRQPAAHAGLPTALPVAEGSATKRRGFPVALVCMPFYSAEVPGIQVGLLAEIAERAGFPAETFHLNVDLAARIGTDQHEALCLHRGHMVGEWLFSTAAFDDRADPDARLLTDLPHAREVLTDLVDDPAARLADLRTRVIPQFVDHWARAVDWGRFGVVGFTSTFQQNVASLALARRIKERHPAVTIVLGGSNVEGEMGPAYLRAFPDVDIVVDGEGDLVLPALLERLAGNEDPGDIPGVVTRRDGVVHHTPPAEPVRDLDALPTPRYDEYFQRWEELGLTSAEMLPPRVPVETSRGCWWGQKHHCTFCGVNGQRMSYRAKSPQRVLDELADLARRHRRTSFAAVDNILDTSYVRNLFTEIDQAGLDYTFFYEVKSSLTRQQLDQMRRGGVRSIQPGIESLSTHVLELMRKGSTMLQNVRLLKWARYHRLDVSWNLLHGFPGEREEDYRRQLDVLELITHLDPPGAVGRIWLERFSPYFARADDFPLSDVTAEASYRYVYPEEVDLDAAAYFFEYQMADTVDDACLEDTRTLVARWRQQHSAGTRDALDLRRIPGGILIDDRRSTRPEGTYHFEGPLAEMYLHCSDSYRNVAEVAAHLDGDDDASGDAPGEDAVRWALEEFCERGLMLAENGRYLSLAVPVGDR